MIYEACELRWQWQWRDWLLVQNRQYSCLVPPAHITAFVLLNPTMKLINDLAPNVHQHSFALEESTEHYVCHSGCWSQIQISHIKLRYLLMPAATFNFTCKWTEHILNIDTVVHLCLLVDNALQSFGKQNKTMIKVCVTHNWQVICINKCLFYL